MTTSKITIIHIEGDGSEAAMRAALDMLTGVSSGALVFPDRAAGRIVEADPETGRWIVPDQEDRPPPPDTAPPRAATKGGDARPAAPRREAKPQAAPSGDGGESDVTVPPHRSTAPRTRHQLIEELAAIIPEVGQTVVVNDFIRDESERSKLKAMIDKHDGDKRFKWIRGIAGGARPARIRRAAP